MYQGLAEEVAQGFGADLVPEDKRGTACGLFHSLAGIMLLPASVIAGWLWQVISPSATFYFGGGLALLATVGLFGMVRK